MSTAYNAIIPCGNNDQVYQCLKCGVIGVNPHTKRHRDSHYCRLNSTDEDYQKRYDILFNWAVSLVWFRKLSYRFKPETLINKTYDIMFQDFNERKENIDQVDKQCKSLRVILPFDVVETIKKYLYQKDKFYYRTLHGIDTEF